MMEERILSKLVMMKIKPLERRGRWDRWHVSFLESNQKTETVLYGRWWNSTTQSSVAVCWVKPPRPSVDPSLLGETLGLKIQKTVPVTLPEMILILEQCLFSEKKEKEKSERNRRRKDNSQVNLRKQATGSNSLFPSLDIYSLGSECRSPSS